MKKLFEYAVILHKYETTEKGKKYVDSEVIIPKSTMLAKDDKAVLFKVTREVPEKYVDDPDNIQIVIRGF